MPEESPPATLRVWQIIGQSLRAPVQLDRQAWLILARPLLAIVALSLVTMLWFWLSGSSNAAIATTSWLLMLVGIAWFVVDYLRLLLLGKQAHQPAHLLLQQYGVTSLMLIALALLLSLLLGMLLYAALPAIAFFAFALISPEPWLAAGIVLIFLLGSLLAAYPVVRLVLMIPALSASHPAMPGRIWSLGRNQGWRLLLLIVIIPGLLNGLLHGLTLVLSEWPEMHWSLQLLISLLNIYLAMFILAILANSYRQLSDIALPPAPGSDAAPSAAWMETAMRPVLVILLLGGCLFLLYETVYLTHPGQPSMISRLGQADRVDTSPGIGLKLPILEDAKPVQPEGGFTATGEDRFLTRNKTLVALSYEADWEVIDSERFRVSMAGKHQIASIRISQLFQDQLRNAIIGLEPQLLKQLNLQNTAEFQPGQPLNPRLDEIQSNINDRLTELGVTVARWRLQQTDNPAP